MKRTWCGMCAVTRSSSFSRVNAPSREVAAQQVGQRSFANGLRQKLGALLVAPAVVDNRLALVLAQVQIGIVDVSGPGDSLPLLRRQLRVGDALVLIRERQHRVEATRL